MNWMRPATIQWMISAAPGGAGAVCATGRQIQSDIIDEVHMLSSAAFNAFLKTLEEPPHYAIFILATTEKHKIPHHTQPVPDL